MRRWEPSKRGIETGIGMCSFDQFAASWVIDHEANPQNFGGIIPLGQQQGIEILPGTVGASQGRDRVHGINGSREDPLKNSRCISNNTDLLSRCVPDMMNLRGWTVGAIMSATPTNLYYNDIVTVEQSNPAFHICHEWEKKQRFGEDGAEGPQVRNCGNGVINQGRGGGWQSGGSSREHAVWESTHGVGGPTLSIQHSTSSREQAPSAVMLSAASFSGGMTLLTGPPSLGVSDVKGDSPWFPQAPVPVPAEGHSMSISAGKARYVFGAPSMQRLPACIADDGDARSKGRAVKQGRASAFVDLKRSPESASCSSHLGSSALSSVNRSPSRCFSTAPSSAVAVGGNTQLLKASMSLKPTLMGAHARPQECGSGHEASAFSWSVKKAGSLKGRASSPAHERTCGPAGDGEPSEAAEGGAAWSCAAEDVALNGSGDHPEDGDAAGTDGAGAGKGGRDGDGDADGDGYKGGDGEAAWSIPQDIEDTDHDSVDSDESCTLETIEDWSTADDEGEDDDASSGRSGGPSNQDSVDSAPSIGRPLGEEGYWERDIFGNRVWVAAVECDSNSEEEDTPPDASGDWIALVVGGSGYEWDAFTPVYNDERECFECFKQGCEKEARYGPATSRKSLFCEEHKKDHHVHHHVHHPTKKRLSHSDQASSKAAMKQPSERSSRPPLPAAGVPGSNAAGKPLRSRGTASAGEASITADNAEGDARKAAVRRQAEDSDGEGRGKRCRLLASHSSPVIKIDHRGGADAASRGPFAKRSREGDEAPELDRQPPKEPAAQRAQCGGDAKSAGGRPPSSLAMEVEEVGCARALGYRPISWFEKLKYVWYDQGDHAGDSSSCASACDVKASGRSLRVEQRVDVQRMGDANGPEAAGGHALKLNLLKSRGKRLSFRKSAIHGWGLHAAEEIEGHDMILEYLGEIVSNKVCEKREQMYDNMGIGSSYMFRIDKNKVIDATRAGSRARYINHSCEPNCQTRIIYVGGSPKVVVYSLRTIFRGEELCYDYKFSFEDGSVPCRCQAITCRGYMA